MPSPRFETTAPHRISYLDRLAASDLGRSYKQRMLDALDVRPGQTVLDLGCGPGTDLGTLAGAVTAAGAVLGIDRDQAMVDAARARTADEPVVDVRLGDVHDLALPDRAADRARTDRVLQHVADPVLALGEIHRVLRPGGRLVMGEPDWETLTIDHPDRELTRAYTRHVADEVVRNAAVGRQLPRLAAASGFTVPSVVPVTSVFRDVRVADQILGLERTTRRAVTAGYFTQDAAERWLAHLAEGPFLAAVTFYIVVAEA
ncbi:MULTISPECIES: methyltransferase domain-containing protein [Streptomyces]|uniref:Ubiquinone biosynthesis protein UbiE n=2 Tax=Streptomyces TaxID=1883 RepID=A0A2N8PIE7_STRNR|nr:MULTISPECIES: methyltransferase domain-containing protein [Streptomyces]PNE40805.1 ubiquinone biosynthesis protein UbiE [Streptomyces noursei]SHM45195.1 Ubiquinone/menaquinone biosynthesis C-methylase UbiE [Streptomyces yunnanensis]